jgi:hypothetical protein
MKKDDPEWLKLREENRIWVRDHTHEEVIADHKARCEAAGCHWQKSKRSLPKPRTKAPDGS